MAQGDGGAYHQLAGWQPASSRTLGPRQLGVLPLQFKNDDNVTTLGTVGDEEFVIRGLSGELRPRQDVLLAIRRRDSRRQDVTLRLRIDTPIEIDYLRHGGILPYVLRELMGAT